MHDMVTAHLPESQKSMRSSSCLCCAEAEAQAEWGMVSAFLARRALGENPAKTRLLRCAACGFSWSERGLTEKQAHKLYVGYRGPEYFAQRHASEPWYSSKINASIGSELSMMSRREAMAGTMESARKLAGERPVGVAMDFGGDKGQMLKDLPDQEKWVYDLSGAELCPWAKKAGGLDEQKGRCDMAMACQVMEHVESPLELARQVVALVKPGGWVYLEVPFEQWRQASAGSAWRARWLDAVARRSWLMMGLDFVSTASRIAFGWVPPFGFWALREHLNFFTEKSLDAVGRAAGLEVVVVERNASGLAMVGIKK